MRETTLELFAKKGWTNLLVTMPTLLLCYYSWNITTYGASGKERAELFGEMYVLFTQLQILWAARLHWKAYLGIGKRGFGTVLCPLLIGGFFGPVIGILSVLGWICYGFGCTSYTLGKFVLRGVQIAHVLWRHLWRTRDQFDAHYQRLRKILRTAQRGGDEKLASEALAALTAIERARQEIALLEAPTGHDNRPCANEHREIGNIQQAVRREIEIARIAHTLPGPNA